MSAPHDPFQNPFEITTLEAAIAQTKQMVEMSIQSGAPCAFEVVARNNGRGPFQVQPFGMHALFKSHKVLHVEPLPPEALADDAVRQERAAQRQTPPYWMFAPRTPTQESIEHPAHASEAARS